MAPRLLETDPLEGSDGAYLEVQAQVAAHPERYFIPTSITTPLIRKRISRPPGKRSGSKAESKSPILSPGWARQGSFVGTARRLKFEDPRVKTLAVQPASPFHGIEGTKHMGSSIKPGILDETLFDDVISVTHRGGLCERATPRPAGRHFCRYFIWRQCCRRRTAGPHPAGWFGGGHAAVRCGLPLFDRPFLE